MPKYKLTELTQLPSPLDSEDYNWFYYIISNDINHISGYREGDKNEVEQYLRETLTRLNNKFKLPEHSYQHNVRKAYEPSPLCY